jgi:SOS-response transcriptional repressor LexA
MNIKEQIGYRITIERKAKKLTQAELAKLAGGFRQSRINNWEKGIRTPGLEEVKQLALILEVSPAFLMCLTDDKEVENTKNSHGALIPLLNHRQACDANMVIEKIREQEYSANVIFISVSTELLPQLSENAFALKMLDDSMIPEIRLNDIQVIDPSVSPKPGDYVAVKISDNPDAFICQFKKLSYTSSEFELLTLNDNWPNLKVNESMQVKILGKMVQNIRGYY